MRIGKSASVIIMDTDTMDLCSNGVLDVGLVTGSLPGRSADKGKALAVGLGCQDTPIEVVFKEGTPDCLIEHLIRNLNTPVAHTLVVPECSLLSTKALIKKYNLLHIKAALLPKGIYVIGEARSGKDTTATILSRGLGIPYYGSSELASELLLEEIKLRTGIEYKDSLEAFNDRVNHRSIWYDIIAEYNYPNKSRLSKGIFSKCALYCGIRSQEELQATLDLYGRSRFFIINVEKKSCKGTDPTFTFSKEFLDEHVNYTLHNEGSLSDLQESCKSIYKIACTFT